MSAGPLHLFEAIGVELEYMLVDAATLDVRPAVDAVLKAQAGSYVSDVEDGPITWSNELVRHVVEVKVGAPVAQLDGLAAAFQASLGRIQALAGAIGARLLPTAMHPWMDPARETELWPHESAEIYRMFDRIFDCRRHGWANLQSVHVNLPFCGDGEFARLHAAIRLVLPLIPALAASSPVMEGRVTGVLDNRLDVYVNNSRKIPHITGAVIPERVFSAADYNALIFQPMFRAIAPYDPEGVLQDEFLNARGAIARFDRGAIEIRLIDVQETPAADLAIVAAVVHAVRAQAEGRYASLAAQQAWEPEPLRGILQATLREGEATMITDRGFLAAWGVEGPARAGDVWQAITADLCPADRDIAGALAHIRQHGTLARRMLRRLSATPSREELAALYRELGDCLAEGRLLD